MHSSTLKGLLIHTADEAGSSPGPDYAFGWGLINMERAAAVITADNSDHSQQIIQSSLSTSKPDTTFTVTASGKMPVVATICWTDVPGTPANIPANSHNFKDVGIKLVNDLDLSITDNVSGKVYLPWILNPKQSRRRGNQG